MAKLTKAQRARLDKLATYLEGLPANYRHFGMLQWLKSRSSVKEANYAANNGGVASCGTAACAAGHGPAAGVLVSDKFIRKEGRSFVVNWEKYARTEFANDEKLFVWLFAGSWGFDDNSHYGAAARIRYALANGRPPVNFYCPSITFVPLYAPYRIDAATLTPDGGM